ncbi:MAG TPA: endolytic transglycosylase MltG [Chitinophagaceae bacterium]|nr:endolytic transglycosylase MltG [Chitinophagaceae bacterium]
MKKKIIGAILGILLVIGLFAAWKLFGSSVTNKTGDYFFIRTGMTREDVRKELIQKNFLPPNAWFDIASRILRFKTVKPGRYKLKKGMSVYKLVKMFRAGDQALVNFVITKSRLPQDIARKAGNQFEFDSSAMMQYLSNADTLQSYGLDSNTLMAVVMPYTYSLNWNSSPAKLFQKFITAYRVFWNATRTRKADSLHLTPVQVITLASIIEEETLVKADKYNIASVYLNRLAINMPLQADPTIKFAMKDFGLKRILNVHLTTPSPYNTYIHYGLPPGPICTASVETVEAVLDAPKTNYFYFVASSNFDGTSVFTTNYNDHLVKAHEYQKALDKRWDSLKKLNPK